MKNNKNFRLFFENNYKKLLKYLTRNKATLGIYCEDDAKEVISEMFYTLATNAALDDTVDLAVQFNYTYLQTMCKNKALQRVKERNNHPLESLYLNTGEENEESVLRNDVVEAICAEDADAEELRAAQIAFLEDLLVDKLTDKQLRLVYGKYCENKSYQDLADELGYCDETVAKATMWRIRERMRRLVDFRTAS